MKSKQPESESSEPESETDSQEGMPTQKKKVRARKQGKMKSKQPESESSEPESETDSQEGMPTQKKKVRARKQGKMKSKQPESESSEPESESDSQARIPSQKKKGEMPVDNEIPDGNEDELSVEQGDELMTGVEQHEVGGEEHVEKETVPINNEIEEKGDELPVEVVKHLNTPMHGSFGPKFGSRKGTIDDEVVLGGKQHEDGEEKWVWVGKEAMPINDEREDVEQNKVGEEKWVWNEKGAMPINDEREERIGVVSMHDQDIEKDGASNKRERGASSVKVTGER
ncbi:hypothetical protein RHMOL_Rhmol06G0252000 [Rhododendron molle]|uniref:Uncharacterized protein n=1 Tax=Rhododendron molle TaxID=49168 RepID=A0ACC0NHH2_RHOML|nr:hypothetical protein RHMOL_Rhmol06G0252000 [Rhododendron molle]